MAVSIKVPSVGESVTEGVIAQWLKSDGDFVEENEPIFELETDKASQEIPAPASGILHIGSSEGETVSIGDEVGQIEPKEKAAHDTSQERAARDSSQGRAAHDSKRQKQEKSEKKEEKKAESKPKEPPAIEEKKKKEAAEKKKEPEETSRPALLSLSPAVRHLVEEKNIDIEKLSGTGRDGRVTKEDVLYFLEEKEGDYTAEKDWEKTVPAAPQELPEKEEPSPIPAAAKIKAAEMEKRQRMSALRQRIAQRLVESQKTTATLTTFNEADMSAVLALRQRYKENFKERYGIGLGFMSFFVKACIEGLKAFPVLNGRIEGNEIVTPHYYNIGVAVSTEKGLMVPVVEDAGNRNFAEIEKIIAALADKARAGKIAVEDLQGGTFTITNGGVFGSLLSTPILNPPQSGILGMHTIQKRPVVVDEQIVIRPMMYLALSYDHRLVDGREAVQFLVRVKECIEDPERMLLEI